MGSTNGLEALLEKWWQQLQAVQPATSPFLWMSVISTVLVLISLFLNIRGMVRLTRDIDPGKRMSLFAAMCWFGSVISAWLGPIALLTTPLLLLLTIVAWIRLPRNEVAAPTQSAPDVYQPQPISLRKSMVAIRLAFWNNLAVLAFFAAVAWAFYTAFGEVVRSILQDAWQHKELFRDYIVI